MIGGAKIVDPAIALGRYQILGEIGRGSSGVVYHARDTLLGREVALKSFQPPRPAPEGPATGGSQDGTGEDAGNASDPHADLLEEARSAGRLSHPNVVTIYDVLEGDDDTLYIAMEYVPGRSLQELLAESRSGSLDFERIVDLVSHIASALDYLHAMGMVHRDVKPANILITHDGRVKLTDFGIAFRGRERGGNDGMVLGTPNYMAPEQILGREITPRTDVWSLGVVLYEMLCGERPFDGKSVAAIVHDVVHAPTPELPEEGGHPSRLQGLLERALAKDPHWRFASAGELARELRRILYHAAGEAGEDLTDPRMMDRTLVSRPFGLSEPGPRGGWKRVVLATVVAVVLGVVAVLAYGAFAGWWSDPASLSSDVATLDDRSLEALRLLQHGQRLLVQGDVPGAATFFEVVERLEPQLAADQAERIRRLRVEAAADADAAAGLEAARSELGAREDRELLASARQRVSREPDREESQETLSALEEAGRRLRERVASRSAAATSATGNSRLTLDFWSEAPEGVLMVYADGEQLLRRGFSYYERGRLFGRSPSSGGFEEELTVPEGVRDLWVYVARPDSPAERLDVSGRLGRGQNGTLRVRLPAEGKATAELSGTG
jgi:hypothetical protein